MGHTNSVACRLANSEDYGAHFDSAQLRSQQKIVQPGQEYLAWNSVASFRHAHLRL